MGQVFLNVLGKHGMLAIWSLIIVVQVNLPLLWLAQMIYLPLVTVRYWSCSSGRRISCGLCLCPRQRSSRFASMEEDQPLYANSSLRSVVRHWRFGYLRCSWILCDRINVSRWVRIHIIIRFTVINAEHYLKFLSHRTLHIIRNSNLPSYHVRKK